MSEIQPRHHKNGEDQSGMASGGIVKGIVPLFGNSIVKWFKMPDGRQVYEDLSNNEILIDKEKKDGC